MWCGSASGKCLLLIIISKAKNLYKWWVKGGLKGCNYIVTKSGWFDPLFIQECFEKYMLFRDNLAVHCKLELIKIAEQKDVYFDMLLPNAPNLLRLLDVCFVC